MTQTNLKSHSTTAKPTPEGTTPNLPARIDRKRGATLITDRFFPISHRTLEKWPLIWRHVNGKATCDTNELLAMAQARLDADLRFWAARLRSQTYPNSALHLNSNEPPTQDGSKCCYNSGRVVI